MALRRGQLGTVVDGELTDVWNPPGTPIPAGTDVYIGSGWLGYTHGLAKTLPHYLLYRSRRRLTRRIR